MKLDRNISPDGKGKYALVLLRDALIQSTASFHMITPAGALDFGDTDDSEFFVIRLKDKYAAAALHAYAESAEIDDQQWATEVRKLAGKAANHPSKKKPD